MDRGRRSACLVALIAACVVSTAGCGSTETAVKTVSAALSTARASASGRATLRVGGTVPVAPLSTAQGFVGVAAELSTIPVLDGPANDPDIPFVSLLRSLSPGAPFLLRLGGVSTNASWWPIPGVKKPPYLYTLTPAWGADVRALLRALGGKVILGVNLEADPRIESAVAGTEVATYNRYIGPSRIDAFELGNEPERIVGNTIPAYGRQFSRVASKLGQAPLAGPGSVGLVWLSQLGTVLGDLPSRLKLVTEHVYPLKDCSASARLSVSSFFLRSSIQGLADFVHKTVKLAAAHGKPLRVGEINGITCGGKAGVSNSFAEALWALNVLPALWQAGVQGVNFQTIDGNHNQMITATHSTSGWRVSVEPEYYGLLAFADAAPAGSRLLRVTGPQLTNVYRFAVRAPDRSERIVLTNVGAMPRTINIIPAGVHRIGSLSLLQARSLSATNDTMLAGQSLSSRTGELAGTPHLKSIRPTAEGIYAVPIPPHTAAILKIPGQETA
jgi:hypothetical protein